VLKEITEKGEWNALVLAGTQHRFSQSWEWGAFEANYGRVLRLAGEKGFTQVEERGLPFGFKVWFVPRGPVGFSREEFAELAKHAREAGAIFVRFEPDTKPEVGTRAAAVDPVVTQLTDLTKSDEQLLAAMHTKTRYNIRLAEKKGVTVAESRDADVWLALHHQTTDRDNFKGHGDSYYREMLKCPLVKMFVASYEGKPLAAMIAVFFGDTATYLHGASSNEARDVMAPFALHWHVMREAKSIGCAFYDWWGLNPEDEANPAFKKSWSGITRFKRGFGGTEIASPGTFELPVQSLLYQLYRARRTLLGKV
jgi:lipid II:glycine glycyltransferase (peptidoglycan interpeptide bridge formation enzyme)